MSLRLKIVLGIIVVPVVTAVALLVLIDLALKRTAEDIEKLNAANQSALDQSKNEWRAAFERRGADLVASWIDANLAGQSEFDVMRVILPRQELFRSAVAFDRESIQEVFAPLVPQTAKSPPGDPYQPTELDRRKCAEALRLHSDARRFSGDGKLLRSGAAIASEGSVFYWAHVDSDAGGNKQPRIVLRLELEQFSIAPPTIEAPKLNFSTLNDTALRMLAVGVALMLVVLLVSVRLLVTKPLEQLVAASRRVGEGDFSRPVPLPGRGGAKGDEIARLIAAFNLMQDEVQRFRAGLEAQIEAARAQIREQERSLMVAQRLAATGTLAAGLAHEINNPLGGMQNAVRRLRKAAAERPATDDARLNAYYDLLEEGLTRIETLMRQVLDFSRRRDSEPQNFDVAAAAQKAADLVRFRFEGDAKLVTELDAAAPRVFGDPAAVTQVVTNLLLNARDALVDGKGEVRLAVRRVSSGQTQGGGATDATEIVVTDTGCGMDAQTAQRIFDPFFTTKEQGKGTGLGLAIVHTVVQNHGGTIEVKSEPGKGAAFVVKLPAAPDDGSATSSAPS